MIDFNHIISIFVRINQILYVILIHIMSLKEENNHALSINIRFPFFKSSDYNYNKVKRKKQTILLPKRKRLVTLQKINIQKQLNYEQRSFRVHSHTQKYPPL